jgi:hypothetical protein
MKIRPEHLAYLSSPVPPPLEVVAEVDVVEEVKPPQTRPLSEEEADMVLNSPLSDDVLADAFPGWYAADLPFEALLTDLVEPSDDIEAANLAKLRKRLQDSEPNIQDILQ